MRSFYYAKLCINDVKGFNKIHSLKTLSVSESEAIYKCLGPHLQHNLNSISSHHIILQPE